MNYCVLGNCIIGGSLIGTEKVTISTLNNIRGCKIKSSTKWKRMTIFVHQHDLL